MPMMMETRRRMASTTSCPWLVDLCQMAGRGRGRGGVLRYVCGQAWRRAAESSACHHAKSTSPEDRPTRCSRSDNNARPAQHSTAQHSTAQHGCCSPGSSLQPRTTAVS